jgi:hypothetical protein
MPKGGRGRGRAKGKGRAQLLADGESLRPARRPDISLVSEQPTDEEIPSDKEIGTEKTAGSLGLFLNRIICTDR